MSQAIHGAAQALVAACDGNPTVVQLMAGIEGLRAALSAPQPTADERVAEHMRLAEVLAGEFLDWHRKDGTETQYDAAYAAVEQSARALLSASQEDAEHAAMYRWLKANVRTGSIGFGDGWIDAGDSEQWDEWIRAAMKETK